MLVAQHARVRRATLPVLLREVVHQLRELLAVVHGVERDTQPVRDRRGVTRIGRAAAALLLGNTIADHAVAHEHADDVFARVLQQDGAGAGIDATGHG